MKVHLIGICGTGMGSFAGLLQAAGHEVRGSDEHAYPPMSTQLAALGVPIMEGFGPQNLEWGPDTVVVGNVNRKDHPEVVAAQERGIALTSFPKLLGELFLEQRWSVVVAGTHGKTTTSTMAAFCLSDAGRDPSYLLGGVPIDLPGSFHLGKGAEFVVEGDEYDTAFFDKGSKFFHYRPKTAILTSVELDHVDIFNSLDQIDAAFAKFVELIPAEGLLIVPGGAVPQAVGARRAAKHARCRVTTYAVGEDADFRADVTAQRGARTEFALSRGGADGGREPLGTWNVGFAGTYNLENAVAVIVALLDRGVPIEALRRAMRRFGGVKRRQELRGVASGVSVVDDFAHHPTAVTLTLRALRGRHGSGRLVAVFEPRSATSRRKTFQREFAEAFANADELIVGPMYDASRIAPEDRFDPERLVADVRARGVAARHLTNVDQIVSALADGCSPGDTVVVMSSGAFGGLHDKLLQRLGEPVMPARPSDRAAIATLLEGYGMPTVGLDDHLGTFLVVRGDDGGVLGCVGIEIYDDAGLLRSLAVLPDRRRLGLGFCLADAALALAASRGVRRLFLVTESASDFFGERLGFVAVPRAEADIAAKGSRMLAADKRARAVTMRRDLDA